MCSSASSPLTLLRIVVRRVILIQLLAVRHKAGMWTEDCKRVPTAAGSKFPVQCHEQSTELHCTSFSSTGAEPSAASEGIQASQRSRIRSSGAVKQAEEGRDFWVWSQAIWKDSCGLVCCGGRRTSQSKTRMHTCVQA